MNATQKPIKNERGEIIARFRRNQRVRFDGLPAVITKVERLTSDGYEYRRVTVTDDYGDTTLTYPGH